MMELWDLLDKDRKPLGRTHPRGQQYPMPYGTYHTVVTVFTVDDRGRLLLTRRAACKGMYPGWWEVTGGSGVAGEDSLTSARRELREETGIDAAPEELLLLGSIREPSAFSDIYLTRRTLPAEDLTLQEGETDAARWVSFWEFETMVHQGLIPPPVALRYGAVLSALQDILGSELWLEPQSSRSAADGDSAGGDA